MTPDLFMAASTTGCIILGVACASYKRAYRRADAEVTRWKGCAEDWCRKASDLAIEKAIREGKDQRAAEARSASARHARRCQIEKSRGPVLQRAEQLRRDVAEGRAQHMRERAA